MTYTFRSGGCRPAPQGSQDTTPPSSEEPCGPSQPHLRVKASTPLSTPREWVCTWSPEGLPETGDSRPFGPAHGRIAPFAGAGARALRRLPLYRCLAFQAVTLRASSPMRRDLRSWSLIMRKGRPYSSKARVPTDAMVDEQEKVLCNNRQGPLGNRESTFFSREDANSRACAVQTARFTFQL